MNKVSQAIELEARQECFDLDAVLSAACDDLNLCPINPQGYFVSTLKKINHPGFRLISPDHKIFSHARFELIQHMTFSDEGLVLGLMNADQPGKACQEMDYLRFKERLLLVQIEHLKGYLSQVHMYLKTRNDGSRAIEQNPVLEQAQAHVISYIHKAQVALQVTETTPFFPLVVKAIDAAALILIKIAGGRSMLRGQAVHMRSVFKIINKIYFN